MRIQGTLFFKATNTRLSLPLPHPFLRAILRQTAPSQPDTRPGNSEGEVRLPYSDNAGPFSSGNSRGASEKHPAARRPCFLESG